MAKLNAWVRFHNPAHSSLFLELVDAIIIQCQARFLAAARVHRPALMEGGERLEQIFPAAENLPRQEIFFFFAFTHGSTAFPPLLVIRLLYVEFYLKRNNHYVCHWILDFLCRLRESPAGIDGRCECGFAV